MGLLLPTIAAGLATMILAAKAHGRQVRLEREREGHRTVVFGGDNPPFVEALWRRDRIAVWASVAAALVVLAVWLVLGDKRIVWLPSVFATDMSFGGSLLLVPLWAMTAGFVVAGLLSRRRLRRRGAGRDAVGWWVAVAAAGVVTIVLAVVPAAPP